jgi:hypothetical protein
MKFICTYSRQCRKETGNDILLRKAIVHLLPEVMFPHMYITPNRVKSTKLGFLMCMKRNDVKWIVDNFKFVMSRFIFWSMMPSCLKKAVVHHLPKVRFSRINIIPNNIEITIRNFFTYIKRNFYELIIRIISLWFTWILLSSGFLHSIG